MLTEDNFIDCNCPHCGASNSFPSESSGHIQECPVCGRDFVVAMPGIANGVLIPLPLTLSTVTLRAVNEQDYADVMPLLPPMTLGTDHPSDHEILKWIESEQHLKFTPPNTKVNLVVECVKTKKVVGLVTLDFIDAFYRQVSVGVIINPSFHRQGFATEAFSAVLHLCFDVFHLHRVMASCYGGNIAGWRLLETVGMRREGELVKSEQVDGQWVNTMLYAMLREEYRTGDDEV